MNYRKIAGKQIKLIIIFILVLLSVSLIIFFHHFLKINVLFAHFLYIPIILSAFWWRFKALWVAIFLSVIFISSNLLIDGAANTSADYIRSLMFIIIGFIVAHLSNIIKIQEDRKNAALVETELLQREIMHIAEKERQRIGQDLHDGIGQNLTAVSFLLENIREKCKGCHDNTEDDLDEIEKLIRKSIVQSRSISKMLYPVEMNSNGLTAAIEEMISSFEKVFDVSCRILYQGNIEIDDNQTAIHLYYIVRESVINAIKHGRAKNITIYCLSDDDLEITVIDDGTGSDNSTHSGGMGLRIMKYRADVIGAGFYAGNRKDKGFEVRVSLQLPQHAEEKIQNVR
ncbi:MAG: sensor histidine kinase [Spirochaetes bacterium]|nr:sensor histidine kinase [Spirochaetota bacterium]